MNPGKTNPDMASSPLRIMGLPNTSALAWELAKTLHQNAGTRPLILVPDILWATQIEEDLKCLAPELKVRCLSPLETDLLRNRGPSLNRRRDRLNFLVSLIEKDPSTLFLLPTESLLQKIPSPSFIHKTLVAVQKNEALTREELSEYLVRLGYLPAELVEKPGEFAVRGSIVDIFSPTSELPVRIELFEDIVQSLRTFQPESQRRAEDLQSFLIPSCREFVYPESGDATQEIKQRLRIYLDQQDWLKPDREALLERIDHHHFFSTIDYWAPLIQPEVFGPSVWDELLKAFPTSIVVEETLIHNEFKLLAQKSAREMFAARIEGDWVPDPSVWLVPEADGKKTLESFLKGSVLSLSLKPVASSTEPSVASTSKSHEILASKLAGSRNDPLVEPLAPLIEQIRAWHAEGIQTLFTAPTPSQLERLQFLLSQHSISFKIHASIEEIIKSGVPLSGIIGSLERGFVDFQAKVAFVLDEEIFGTKKKRVSNNPTRARNQGAKDFLAADLSLLDLKPNDFLVHAHHGIGRYLGLRTIPFNGIPSELIEIEYRDGSKLLVPVTKLDLIHKHSGGGEDNQLDRLGGQTWDQKKAKVRRDLQNLAGELLHIYSKREMVKGPEIQPDKRKVDEFAATFPYIETTDQASAIEKTLQDLRGPRPTDRLICGDVGYGKTEVALRAAHAALAAGWQVAVLVPTTLLAAQHENTFTKRLAPLGFQVAGLSRFKSSKESKKTLEGLAKGEIHVVVGTHRLLSADLRFSKLGLLVIDEEQRFGVAHKEKIKKMRANVHVLTLTATPIPRTLNMAMSGLKEISIISTPPGDRLSVRTHVARKKPQLIQEAVTNELKRGGQVFYLHNRIQTMQKELEELQKLLPGIAIESVHGQMNETELEKKMLGFYEGRTQVLLTTSIIESGLDIPNANTLIVDRADMFGLSQLYQIRGRVGRSAQRAYAYFLIPESGTVTVDAEERLSVLEAYQELGSGFHIASHDLELRGAGDILGGSQSGHILSIGLEAYTELLQEAVAESRGESIEHLPEPEITLGIDTTLPESYIPEVGLRLMFYRKLASAAQEEEIEATEKELEDRFGPFPESVKNLLGVMRVKCQLRRLGVSGLVAGKAGCLLTFEPSTPVNPVKIVEHLKRYPSLFHFHPDGRLLIKRPAEGQVEQELMRSIEGALSLLESWCG